MIQRLGKLFKVTVWCEVAKVAGKYKAYLTNHKDFYIIANSAQEAVNLSKDALEKEDPDYTFKDVTYVGLISDSCFIQALYQSNIYQTIGDDVV